MKKKTPADLCPCGSEKPFCECCGRFLSGEVKPETPEALMRSRYSAYAKNHAQWVADTWAPETRPEDLTDVAESRVKWLGLKILRTAVTDETHGTVEFVARGRLPAGAFRMHEASRFEKREGDWFYVDGDLKEK